MGTNPMMSMPPQTPMAPAPPGGIAGQMAGPQAGPPGMGMDPMGGGMDQNAGVLEVMKELAGGLTQAQDFMMAIASQFPASAPNVRVVIEALDMASKGLIDVLTAVVGQSSMEPKTPPYIG